MHARRLDPLRIAKFILICAFIIEAMNWRTFDLKTLETQYSPSSMVQGNYQPFLQSYAELSAMAYATCPNQTGLRYGSGERALLDFFPAKAPTGELLVFFHGGYWQELSRQDSTLLAPAWTNRGVAHAVIGYDLAPQVSLVHIVQQCQEALVYLAQRADQLGFDRQKIVLVGSSAGAHLAMLLCLMNHGGALRESRGALAVTIKAAILLSGIYDLAPLVPTYVNSALSLTEHQAACLSPLHLVESIHSPELFPDLLIAWAEHDTQEFKRQSRDFARAMRVHGVQPQEFEDANSNHFSILNRLADPSTALFVQADHLIKQSSLSHDPIK
jgi:arylformamidase